MPKIEIEPGRWREVAAALMRLAEELIALRARKAAEKEKGGEAAALDGGA